MSIKLNFRAALAGLAKMLTGREDVASTVDEPSSMVLLLQTSEFPNLKQLGAYAEKAFKVPFATENVTDFCVFQKALFTLMQIGPHVLSFMYYTRPYFEKYPGLVRQLPFPQQRVACDRHTAWLAINYAKGNGSKDIQYAILSRLCIEMLDDNCTAAYVPGEQLLIPNDGSLVYALQQNVTSNPDLGLPPLTVN